MISIKGINYTASSRLDAPISHVVKGQPYPPSCCLCEAVSTFPHLVNIECVRQPQCHRNNATWCTAIDSR